jgi:hypothetical protein
MADRQQQTPAILWGDWLCFLGLARLRLGRRALAGQVILQRYADKRRLPGARVSESWWRVCAL